MTLALVIILFLVGIALILLELLVTPGFVIGLIGLLFIACGIYLVYENFGDTAGHVVLGLSIVSVSGIVITALKSGAWKKISLEDTISAKAVHVSALEVGQIGETISALRPSGNALFNEEKQEVTTQGEPVEPNTKIEIIEINQNKIFVKKV